MLGFEAGPPDALALALDGERVAWADGHGALAQLGLSSSASMSISSPSCHVPSAPRS